jgi:hypothetical protein
VVPAFLRLAVFALALMIIAESPNGLAAQEENVLAEHGCVVEPQEPEVYDGEIHSPVRLECESSLEGRLIITELQQRRADGSYQNVPGTRLMFEAYEPVMGDEMIMEHSASGGRIECRSVDGLQEFRTAVKVRGSGEATGRAFSNSVNLPQDCFGDELEPIVSEADAQLRLACQTDSLTDKALAVSLSPTPDGTATPVVSQSAYALDEALQNDALPEAELPVGANAGDETIAAIAELESEFADCLNAGELRRAASLLTGDFQREFLELAAVEGFPGNRFEHPYPFPIEYRVTAAVRDVSVFPDGRVGAIVDWESVAGGAREANFRAYEQVDGEWRIADEIKFG